MLVKNRGTRAVPLGAIRLQPGETAEVPDDLMCRPRPVALRKEGILGIVRQTPEGEKIVPIHTDDLTKLGYVGKGRDRLMREEGIVSYAGVVEAGAEKLADLLNIDIGLAEEIVESARKKLNG